MTSDLVSRIDDLEARLKVLEAISQGTWDLASFHSRQLGELSDLIPKDRDIEALATSLFEFYLAETGYPLRRRVIRDWISQHTAIRDATATA